MRKALEALVIQKRDVLDMLIWAANENKNLDYTGCGFRPCKQRRETIWERD